MTERDSPSRESSSGMQEQAASGSYRALVWVGVVCGLINVAGPTMLRLGNTSLSDYHDVWIFVVLAGMGAAAAYVAWSQRSLSGRLLRGVGVWLGTGATIAIGTLAMHASRGELSESLGGWTEAATGFGLVAIAIQTPLVVLRWVLGLRIASREFPRGSKAGRTSIADLLAVMTVAAAGLAFLRLIPESDGPPYWSLTLAVMGVLGFATTLVAPATAGLISQGGTNRNAIAWTFLSLAAFGIVLIEALRGLSFKPGDFLPIALGLLIFTTAWTSILAAARHAGWRLFSRYREVNSPLE